MKFKSWIEPCTNTFIGVIRTLIIVWIYCYITNMPVTFEHNLYLTLLLTICSIIQNKLVIRYFRRTDKKTVTIVSTPLIYLASPYTHKNKSIMAKRFIDISNIAAKLTNKGLFIFSPISMNHPWKEYSDEPLGYTWEFWQTFDTKLLDKCDEILVAMMPGWKESIGVQAEIKIARQLGKPVKYLNVDTMKIHNEVQ